MPSIRTLLLVTAVLLALNAVEAKPKPLFDALYDALSGNGRRSYGYGGYGGYGGYEGYGGYGGGYNNYPRERPTRTGKNWKDICRAHYPDSVAFPGSGGVVCPY